VAEFTYVLSNKRLPDLIEAIQSASVPEKFNREFLKGLGFTSSNDRAFVPLFKSLGLIDGTGIPTERYRSLRQYPKSTLAEAIREMYSDAWALDENLHKRGRDQIVGIFRRITDKDEAYVKRVAATFKALSNIADFDAGSKPVQPAGGKDGSDESLDQDDDHEPSEDADANNGRGATVQFRHSIEIHLPATKDIAVYNAIFKSIKDNLL